ncbi:hypothetical protein MHU86_2635 [Fragilaria crotonensis]|nr:hypothetical protein MHU86_2635 [Fragilaria crotonensis]
MTEYIASIVRDFEKDLATTLKDYKTPGAAVTPLYALRQKTKLSCMSCIGRMWGVMFACGKSEPTISNACRELTCHLNAPNATHWSALKNLIGYLKGKSFQGLKMSAEGQESGRLRGFGLCIRPRRQEEYLWLPCHHRRLFVSWQSKKQQA